LRDPSSLHPAEAGFPRQIAQKGEAMPLEKKFIRDGRNRLVGSVTSGYSDTTEVVRDAEGKLLGKTSRRFSTTRDAHNRLISIDTPDAGLLFGRDDE
jgi:YD repeat-containing protein